LFSLSQSNRTRRVMDEYRKKLKVNQARYGRGEADNGNQN
jgi:hypothetical protein